MAIETELVGHLAQGGYHPRTSRHSDFQSSIIIRDLVAQCPLIAKRAAAGDIVAKLRHHQQVGHADWVIDIAIGTRAGAAPVVIGQPITVAPPVIIQIAIELKSIWTEHGKARRNRLRDLNSFHVYAHQYNPNTVAAGFLVVNSAERFWSPLRDATDITVHGQSIRAARELAQKTLDIFRSIYLRHNSNDVPGMEAMGVVVVEHDNLDANPNAAQYTNLHKPTIVAPTPPNPPVGDPLHYETMIQRICNAYTERFP
jgi:hypothetical protein